MKVLIVTYYWPPAGGPGVQRWLYFAKYLSNFGIEPIVFIPENPDYPILDDSLQKEIPADVKVITFPIIEPYAIAKKLSKSNTTTMSKGVLPNENKQSFLQKSLLWIRGNCFIPDARVLWVKPAIKFLEKCIEENNINSIITTGPPHSVHLIGLGLKNKLGIKWIADFRDPWTSIGYHAKLKLNKRAIKKHSALEKEVLNTCNLLIVTSKGTKKHFETKTSNTIKVITNGFEPNEIDNNLSLDTQFTISHIGSFLSDRNPKILWEALSELIQEEKKFAAKFKLQLVGIISDAVIDSIKSFGLKEFLENKGYVSHEEALVHQKKSQLLLLVEIDAVETKQIIPGKLFEYLKSGRPILAVTPSNSEVASIITTTNCGAVFNYSEKEALKTYIYNCFRLYEKKCLNVKSREIEQYTRKNLTAKLAEEIHQLWDL